jgi:hypothetical protein
VEEQLLRRQLLPEKLQVAEFGTHCAENFKCWCKMEKMSSNNWRPKFAGGRRRVIVVAVANRRNCGVAGQTMATGWR